MKQLLLKIAETGGAKIYAVFLGILTLSITARWLGPEGRGIYAAVTTWVVLFIDLSHLSIGTALIYRATGDRDHGWIGRVMGNLLSLTIVVTFISWCIAALIYIAGNYWGLPNLFRDLPLWPLLLGFLILPFGIWESYSQSLLNIENKLSYFNRLQVAGSTSNSIMIVLTIVVAGFGVIGAIFSKLIWQAIIAIGGIRKLLRIAQSRASDSIPAIATNLGELSLLIKDGLKVHLGILGTLMILNIDIIMVNAYLGAEQTGIYQLAVQASQLMLIISYAGMTVLQGEVTKVGPYAVWNHQKKILYVIFGFLLFACVAAALTAPWWLLWLAGNKFAASVPLFQWLMLTVLEHSITNVLSVQFVARGWLWQLSLMNISKGLLNVGLNMWLIPKYGVEGAVFATLLVSAYMTIINIVLYFYFDFDVRKRIASGELAAPVSDEAAEGTG